MPITARGNSWQASVTRNGRRFRLSFATRAEAEKWEQEAIAALDQGRLPTMEGTLVGRQSMTVKEAFDYTCTNRWRDKSKSLIINGQAVVDALGPTTQMARITKADVDLCIQKWAAQGNTSGTINRKLSALSTLITEARDLGIAVPTFNIRWQKETEHRLRYFHPNEEEQILTYYRHIGRPDLADLCAFACDTGLRLGALLKLLPTHFDFGHNDQATWLRLPGGIMKNGKEHHIPITGRAREVAIRRIKETKGGKLFPFTKDSVEHHWKTMRNILGYAEDKQFVFHTWRHTYCSRLVQAGVPIAVIQKLAGHETLAVTMRYAKLAGGNLVSAVGILEQAAQKIPVTHDTRVWHAPGFQGDPHAL